MYRILSAIVFLLYPTSSFSSSDCDDTNDRDRPRFELTISDQLQDTYTTAYGDAYNLIDIVECLSRSSFPPTPAGQELDTYEMLTVVTNFLKDKRGVLALGTTPDKLESVWLMTQISPELIEIHKANYGGEFAAHFMTSYIFGQSEGLEIIRMKIPKSQERWCTNHAGLDSVLIGPEDEESGNGEFVYFRFELPIME
jgi:hypothetical protein